MKNMRFIYTKRGTTELVRERFRNMMPNDHKWIKPTGGIWFCEYTPNEKYVSSWQRWCIGEMFNHDRVVNDGITFSISSNARVYVINTAEDFFNLKGKYSNSDVKDRYSCDIDWYAIAQDYDVVYLTKAGIRVNYYNMYGWDIESGVVLNFDVIENQEHVSLNPNRWFGERYAINKNPEGMRSYIYSFNARGKIGYQSGIVQAKDSYDAYEKIVQQYAGDLCSVEGRAFREKIYNSMRIVYVCEDGTFCECY